MLKELSGDPTQTPWKPEVEVFKDAEHISRASQQLTIMSLSRANLADVIAKAEKEHSGTAFSVSPVIRDGKAMFAVLEADKGKVIELDYDAMDGKLIRTAMPKN